MARPVDLAPMLAGALLIAAAPPQVDSDLPKAAPGFAMSLDTGPALVFLQPKRDAPIEPVVAAQVVARLVALHLLDDAAAAQDPAKAAEAIRGFQAGLGIRPTGVLDRKTLALMAL